MKPKAVIRDYKIIDKIASGSFSTVYSAVHMSTGIDVSIKVIDKSTLTEESHRQMVDNEINIMKTLDHPFIIEFFDEFEDPQFIYVVMEYIEGGSCLSYVNTHGRLKEEHARHIFVELLSALEYLHKSKGIMHRDIKAENVLIDRNNNIRLVDFGFATEIKKINSLIPCGSPAYAAPEVLKGNKCTEEADIWAAGVLLYAITAGDLPFVDENMQRLLQKIIYTEPKYGNITNVSLKDLLSKLLKKDLNARITMDNIRHHPWVMQYNLIREVNFAFGVNQFRRLPIDEELLNECLNGEDKAKAKKDIEEGVSSKSSILYRILRRQKNVDKYAYVSRGIGTIDNAYKHDRRFTDTSVFKNNDSKRTNSPDSTNSKRIPNAFNTKVDVYSTERKHRNGSFMDIMRPGS